MNIRALVADDSRVVRAIIVDSLRDIGVSDIIEAADGREAVELVEQYDFNLIVLDWRMPRMSGLEVVETIRAMGSDVPILMVTAVGTEKEHVLDAIGVGVSDYLLKPFNTFVLQQKLSKLCQRDESSVEMPLQEQAV